MKKRLAKKIAGPPPKWGLVGYSVFDLMTGIPFSHFGVKTRRPIHKIVRARWQMYGNESPSKEWIESQ